MSKPGEEGQVMQELVLNRLIATSGAVGCPPPAQEAPPSWGQIKPHGVAEMCPVLLEEGWIHWPCGLCPVRNWDIFFLGDRGRQSSQRSLLTAPYPGRKAKQAGDEKAATPSPFRQRALPSTPPCCCGFWGRNRSSSPAPARPRCVKDGNKLRAGWSLHRLPPRWVPGPLGNSTLVFLLSLMTD